MGVDGVITDRPEYLLGKRPWIETDMVDLHILCVVLAVELPYWQGATTD